METPGQHVHPGSAARCRDSWELSSGSRHGTVHLLISLPRQLQPPSASSSISFVSGLQSCQPQVLLHFAYQLVRPNFITAASPSSLSPLADRLPCAGLPLLFLLGYEDASCLLASALALTTHLTCALKDLLCGPRPAHACWHTTASSPSKQGNIKPTIKAGATQLSFSPVSL